MQNNTTGKIETCIAQLAAILKQLGINELSIEEDQYYFSLASGDQSKMKLIEQFCAQIDQSYQVAINTDHV